MADSQRGVQFGAADRGWIEVTAKRNHCPDKFVSTDTSDRLELHMRSSFGKCRRDNLRRNDVFVSAINV